MSVLTDNTSAWLAGLSVSLSLCLIAWSTGIFVGTILGIAGTRLRFLARMTRGVNGFLLSVPLIVLLFYAHYPLQALLAITIPPFATGAAILSVCNCFAVAEIVRSELMHVPVEHLWVARMSNLPPQVIAWRVMMPLVSRHVMGPLLVQQVAVLQASLLTSFIGVQELFRAALRVNAVTLRPIPIFTALAIILLVVCLPVLSTGWYLARRASARVQA